MKKTFVFGFALILSALVFVQVTAVTSAPSVIVLPMSGAQQAATTQAPSTQEVPPYKNSALPVSARVDDLLARLTLDEKIGQMTLVERNSLNPADIAPLGLGGLLSGGDGSPRSGNSAQAWADMVDGYQRQALQSRLAVPMIYGVDAVHGHAHLSEGTIFPHNIGLGATNDPKLVTQIGQAVAQEMVATGIYWNYAPVVAVVQDVRWGRTYESFGENTELVTALSSAYIQGLQGSVLATPKHFIGDGGTKWGSSTTQGYSLDQGVTDVDEATLRALYLPPYIAALKDGALSVMVSFSSWGGMKMHAQRHLLTEVLKGELGFKGFIVSDWAGIYQIPGDTYKQVVTAINAGIDMNMVPDKYQLFISTLRQAVNQGDVSMQRIDDAVRRILMAKFAIGLFEHPFSDPKLLSTVGSAEHRALARQAVSESAVLLKNDNAALPLAKDVKNVFVAGQAANDIGIQSGGWTITWQGKPGPIVTGTTILDAVKKSVSSSTTVTYDANGEFAEAKDASGNPLKADVCIVGVGERPYAEGVGDSRTLALPNTDQGLAEQMRDRCGKEVVVVISGRPVIINAELKTVDAVVAAWLPGSEGQGVTDVLFGDKPFTGKLSFTWPRSADQLPFDLKNLPAKGCDAPLFPYGYGLDAAQKTTYQDSCAQ